MSGPISDTELVEGMRRSMRGLASSVSVLTCRMRDGSRHAMVATSVTSLCLDPPAMLVCVNRSASFHRALAEQQGFCINILGRTHLPVANQCATGASGEARFAGGDWLSDESGIPYLADAQAAILCTQEQRMSYGTHDIVIGRVRDVRLAGTVDPLLYADGAFCWLHRESDAA